MFTSQLCWVWVRILTAASLLLHKINIEPGWFFHQALLNPHICYIYNWLCCDQKIRNQKKIERTKSRTHELPFTFVYIPNSAFSCWFPLSISSMCRRRKLELCYAKYSKQKWHIYFVMIMIFFGYFTHKHWEKSESGNSQLDYLFGYFIGFVHSGNSRPCKFVFLLSTLKKTLKILSDISADLDGQFGSFCFLTWTEFLFNEFSIMTT